MCWLTRISSVTLLAVIMPSMKSHAQTEPKRWKNEVLAEVNALDVFDLFKGDLSNSSFFLRYRGQTLRYSLKYNFHKQFAAGIETGLFLHTTNGQSQRIYHSYIPLQVAIRYSTKNDHFGISLISGIPLMLTHNYQYIGTNGLWYKHVEENPPLITDDKLMHAQHLQVDQYKSLSEIRFHFRLQRLPHAFWHVGLQHYYINAHVYLAGFEPEPYEERKGGCFNVVYGLSYQF